MYSHTHVIVLPVLEDPNLPKAPDCRKLLSARRTIESYFWITIGFVMSTRRLIDGENDPEMHTNKAVHLWKPAIAKGKPNLTPGGKKKKDENNWKN